MTEISIVVPVRNEEQCIKPFLDKTVAVLNKIGKKYEIIFSLDPSSDKSEKIILNEMQSNKNIKLLVFSRRFGQPAATMAGIFNCQGSYCIIIDVDLQDPPEVLPTFFSKILEGYDVVYAIRRSRKEGLFKKICYFIFYTYLSLISIH